MIVNESKKPDEDMWDHKTKGEKKMAKPIKDKFPASSITKRQNWQSGIGKKDLIITQNDL
ncbi:MAG: hypothetical protein OIN84_00050 [Candidatus Methanoperedens sp.]|nr:hypothetical protein [Candidatus Methanoperedens nitroreducens]MCX9076342.1 hypothetical protein [Candidatus Methanoperedens sp.]